MVDLFAIASADAVTTKFPQPLHLIQQYPWWSVLLFSLIGLLLAILLYRHENGDDDTKTPPSGEQGNDAVKIEGSKLNRSKIWGLKGVRIWIAGSKLKDSTVVVRDDSTPRTR